MLVDDDGTGDAARGKGAFENGSKQTALVGMRTNVLVPDLGRINHAADDQAGTRGAWRRCSTKHWATDHRRSAIRQGAPRKEQA